ncbi:MAG: anti-sigma factor antagonist [Calditrichaeota bacterium]|nr:MAG: anti-sigma factor antagonist [Calditrichota bacterium]
MEGIQVSVENAGPNQSISVIKVGGYIDTTTSAELEHSLSNILKSNCYNVVIDLANVDYISSAGWGIFISEIKGIREKGGDLKLVGMIPDVYEVFELLEFHYILKAFDTLEEAIADFDHTASSPATLQPPTNDQHNDDGSQVVTRAESGVMQIESDFQPAQQETSFQTIEEKLRQIIIENPDAGTFQIIKALNTPRFGNIKLGWFEMRKYLKQLNLDSKKKRIAYFKQKSFS